MLLKELLIHENKPNTKRLRSCRRHLSNTGWWETVNSEYSDERFKQTFRVSRETFIFLLSKIEHEKTKKKQQRLLLVQVNILQCAFTNLLEGDYYCAISVMTGIRESTVINIVDEACQVIVENMWHEFVEKYFPSRK